MYSKFSPFNLLPASPLRHTKLNRARLATLLSEENIDTSLVGIYTSPFSRCLQTAQHIAEALGIPTTDNPSFQQTDTLAERNFGSFELQSSQHYESIWEEDAKDPSYVPGGSGESCKDVVLRFERFLEKANKDVLATLNGGGTLGNCVVIVVGHGDGLSCGASRLLGSHLENHRQHGLENCGIMEIRKK